jgi:hypothetical protein
MSDSLASHKMTVEMKNSQVGTISAQEFVDFGYLQELNRVFLAPLGFIMDIIPPARDKELGELKIYDFRQVPEKALLSTDKMSSQLADNVSLALDIAGGKRLKKIGFVYQPVSGDVTEANAT